MRTIVTLVLVVAVLNAVGHLGRAYWKYYQFRDAAHEIVLFGGMTPTPMLHGQVVDKATKLEIPIDSEQISVTRDGQVTVIEAEYRQEVELLPRYSYPLSFRFSVNGVSTGEVALPH
jgi:hypothetical protein